MKLFNVAYFLISAFIIIFQSFTVPRVFCDYSKESLSNKVRKFIEQFLSSLAGFFLLYYLILKSVYAITCERYDLFGITDILLLVIALIGVSGFLSLAIYKTAGEIGKILGNK